MQVKKGEAEVKVRAPMNMALIKYWGKRNEYLMLPLNDSISVTVNALFAQSTVRISTSFNEHSVMVNGKSIDICKGDRYHRCFDAVKTVLRKRGISGVDDEKYIYNWYCQVESETNFPIEAGLASSAAGFAALVYGLGKIFELDDMNIWRIARLGSGSACRSVFGGFLHWIAGSNEDGLDCSYSILGDENYWAELRVIVAVCSCASKSSGSTNGMQLSVETSELLSHRVKSCVPKHVAALKLAVESKDFAELGRIIMQESNQLHAICLDTQPPLLYLNQNSMHLIKLVLAYNKFKGEVKVAYTFDAGPNCCLFMLKETVSEFMQYLKHYSDASKISHFIRGETKLITETEKTCDLPGMNIMPNSVMYAIVSTLGMPPTLLS